MTYVNGTWLGEERIVVGCGTLIPGEVSIPEEFATLFEKQNLFVRTPTKKESKNVRAHN